MNAPVARVETPRLWVGIFCVSNYWMRVLPVVGLDGGGQVLVCFRDAVRPLSWFDGTDEDWTVAGVFESHVQAWDSTIRRLQRAIYRLGFDAAAGDKWNPKALERASRDHDLNAASSDSERTLRDWWMRGWKQGLAHVRIRAKTISEWQLALLKELKELPR